MRVIIQKVSKAQLIIDNQVHSEISQGMVVFVGISRQESHDDLAWLCRKILNMRIFYTEDDKEISILDIKGSIMVVSQFTLFASCKKGNRPSYTRAAPHDEALSLYETFVKMLRSQSNIVIEEGVFQADMRVSLVNQGPMTFILDSKLRDL